MPSIRAIAVTSRSRAGFRRLGRRFTREPTQIAVEDLSEEELVALTTDPRLLCEEIEIQAKAVELKDMKVEQLRAVAAEEEIDLGIAKLKAEIIAAIEAARETKAEAERQAAKEAAAAATAAAEPAGTGADSTENEGEA